MDKKIIIALTLVVLLGGYLIWSSCSKKTSSQEGNAVVTITQLGLSFELPQGYVAYQTEGFEGGYSTSISIGKEEEPNHLKYAGVKVDTFIAQGDPSGVTEGAYLPEEYIDFILKNGTASGHSEVTPTTLLGNKAVRYLAEADGSPVVIGYMSNDGYGLKITSSVYGTGVSLNEELFETILSSLKITEKQ